MQSFNDASGPRGRREHNLLQLEGAGAGLHLGRTLIMQTPAPDDFSAVGPFLP
jgi:hypothetical protein